MQRILPPPKALHAALQWQQILQPKGWLCVVCLGMEEDPQPSAYGPFRLSYRPTPLARIPRRVLFPSGEILPISPSPHRLYVCGSCARAHRLAMVPYLCAACGSVTLVNPKQVSSASVIISHLWGWQLNLAKSPAPVCADVASRFPPYVCPRCRQHLEVHGWVEMVPPVPPLLAAGDVVSPTPEWSPRACWATIDRRLYRSRTLCLEHEPTPEAVARARQGHGFRGRVRAIIPPSRLRSLRRRQKGARLHLVPFRLRDLKGPHTAV